MSQLVRDRWSPELGPEDLSPFLEVTGYPRTSPCGVSEMVAEGEGTGIGWVSLSKSRQNGVAKSLADTVTPRSPPPPPPADSLPGGHGAGEPGCLSELPG